jgi:hypothetical protein
MAVLVLPMLDAEIESAIADVVLLAASLSVLDVEPILSVADVGGVGSMAASLSVLDVEPILSVPDMVDTWLVVVNTEVALSAATAGLETFACSFSRPF